MTTPALRSRGALKDDGGASAGFREREVSEEADVQLCFEPSRDLEWSLLPANNEKDRRINDSRDLLVRFW